jgi:hypothetical protein
MGTGFSTFDSIGGDSGAYSFRDDGTTRLFIDSNGNVGIGISNPLSKLHIGDTLSNSSDAPNALIIKQTSTNETTGIYLERSGERKGYYIYVGGSLDSLNFQRNNAGTKSDTLTLTRDANVGIGTLTPSSRLGVRANGADGIVLEQDAGASNNSGRLFFLGDVQTYGMFNNAGDIRITHSAQPGNTSGTSFARFTNTGKYFRMESGTGGIQFGGDTAAANALDDYEEGTFTPTISGLQLSTMSASYVKIGSLVHVMATMAYISGTGSGNIISGLPFSAAGNHRSGVTFGNVNGVSWGSGATAPFGFIYNNQIACYGFSNNAGYTTADFSTFGSGDFIEFSGVYNIL